MEKGGESYTNNKIDKGVGKEHDLLALSLATA